MNSKKCKVLRRMAEGAMVDYPAVAYEPQTTRGTIGTTVTGEPTVYHITNPITLDVCVRKYYKFLKRTTAAMLRSK